MPLLLAVATASAASADSSSHSLILPGGEGKLTVNAWIQHSGDQSGNTITWDYQTSAVYSGSKKVQRIRTTWYAGASIRNSASISLGVSSGGISYATSASWENVKTPAKHWENTNGAKSSSWRSNILIGPAKYYQSGSKYLGSTGLVKVKGDKRTYQISAGA